MSKNKKNKVFQLTPENQIDFIKTSKLGKFSFTAIKVLVYTSFLAPLFFFWPSSLVEFLLPKNILFIALSFLTAFFLIVHFIENQPVKVTRWQLILFVMLGVWLLFRLITLFVSVDVVRSFWGGPTRYEGDILFIALSVFTIACTQVFKTKKQINRFLVVISLIAGLLAFYGLLQKWGIFFFNETWKNEAVTRASSLFGNPLFLSSFLAITLMFTIYSLWQKENRHLKYELIISIIFQIAAIFLAECSSTYLALAVMIFIFFFIYFLDKKKYISLILLFMAIGSVSYIALTSFNVIAPPNYLESAIKDLNMETQSNAQRIYLWQSGWRAFIAKPLIGWGNEMAVIAYNQYRDTRLVEPLEFNFDRFHNWIIDQLVYGGVIGTGLFLMIIFYSAYIGYRRYRESIKVIYLVLAVIPIVFVINMFFSIPVLANYLLLFLAIGLIFTQFSSSEYLEDKKIKKKFVGLYTVLAIGGLWLIIFSFKPLAALVYCKTALAIKEFPLSVAEIDKSLEFWSFEETASMKLRLYIKELNKNNGQVSAAFLIEAAEAARALSNKYPYSFMILQYAGEIFSYLDETEMNKYFSRAVELAPSSYETYWAWGDAYFRLKNPQKALEKYQAAIDLNPAADYPREKLKQLEDKLKIKSIILFYNNVIAMQNFALLRISIKI